jgi:hypothetical protein
MLSKTFEIRDRATFIAAIATRIDDFDNPLVRRCGYLSPSVLLCRLDGTGRVASSHYDWGDRTMHVAHNYIEQHWDALSDRAVIDVEFILGETQEIKASEST